MTGTTFIFLAALFLLIAQWVAQTVLAHLNRRHVLQRRDAIPPAFQGVVDLPTYQKSTEYTLARSRFGVAESAWSLLILLGILSSSVLPNSYSVVTRGLGEQAWAQALWLFSVALLMGGSGIALGLVGAVSPGGTFRVQHHDSKGLVG